MTPPGETCPLCRRGKLSEALRYDAPPAGETAFPSLTGRRYERAYDVCDLCGVFVARLSADLERFYTMEYVDATYGDRLRESYERIMALPPERSDNAQRVAAINEFMGAWWKANQRAGGPPTVLDVGSGLGVFSARMKEAGWRCTALDPDPRAAEHARMVVGVDAICGDFMQAPVSRRYDLVAFNKVLEHVPDPVAMLARSREFLAPGGIVYIEVPDGEAAVCDSSGREEFFIEHLWVFSARAVTILAHRSGLVPQRLERLREPSGKYTLRCFASLDTRDRNRSC